MTWNDHVRHQREAYEFMGLAPPAAVLAFDFVPAPPPKAIRCRRPEAPSIPYPERVPGRQPTVRAAYSMFVRTPLSDAEKAYKPESDRILAMYEHLRPVDAPNDCRPGMPNAIRPCPFASCRHHLGITVNESGSIKVDHGHTDWEKLEETCTIDVVAKGRQTHKTVARLTGISTDWVRATERELRASLTRKARRVSSDWGPADEGGRQTCVPCRGSGEEGEGGECTNCDGEGYRWGKESHSGPTNTGPSRADDRIRPADCAEAEDREEREGGGLGTGVRLT